MKKYLTLALGLAIAMPLLAQLPRTLSFQGYLTNDAGEPITTESDSPLSVSFTLYTEKALGSGMVVWGPETHEIDIDKGIFNTILGASEITAVPLDFGSTLSFDNPYFLQITIDPGPNEEILPRIELTSGMYSLSSVNASNITSGTLSGGLLDQVDASIIAGSVAIANGGTGANSASDARTNLGVAIGVDVQAYDADLDDLADGSLSGSKIGSGIDADSITVNSLDIEHGGTDATTAIGARANLGLTIGTDVQAQDADLDDLADGTLTGSKVGTGIDAANITTNSLAVANGGTGATSAANARTNLGLVIGTDVQAQNTHLTDLADGTLTGSKVGTGIDASNLTAGTLPDARLEPTVDLTAMNASGNVTVDGFTTLGDDGSAPSIKMKIVTGTTIDNVNGGLATIAHGVTDHLDILSISIFVENSSGSLVPPNVPGGTNFFYYVIDATNINVITTDFSTDLRNQDITATIVYRQ